MAKAIPFFVILNLNKIYFGGQYETSKKGGQNFELNIHAETVDFKGETYDIIIHDGDVGRAGHIASNNFLVKDDHIDLLIEQFKGRKGNVDKYQGFEVFMLIRN